MADYPIEDDRSRDRVTCSGSLSLGNAPGHRGNSVGKEEAAEDGESSEAEQESSPGPQLPCSSGRVKKRNIQVSISRCSLQNRLPVPASPGGISPSMWRASVRKLNLLPFPAPPFLNAEMLKLVCSKVMVSYLKDIKLAPEWNVISSS